MPNYYNPYPQYYPQTYQSQPVVPSTQTNQPVIQNNGFVSVRNETEARNYPVAIGNSVTFKDETAPYVYTKTMGFSQLDRPIFEKYKLVKEDVAESTVTETFNSTDELKSEVDELKDELNELKGEINAIKAKISTRRKKDVGAGNDEQSE